MKLKKFLPVTSALLIFPLFLQAAPQDQEVFLDFEGAEGSGQFTLGEPPNDIQFLGFTIETLEDPTLLHSGTKALTLGPSQEGRIVSSRGINTIEFYAAESTGGGKIEIRGDANSEGGLAGGLPFVTTVIGENGEVEGLPANISPGANPPLQSFVADSGNFLDGTDQEFIEGIKEIKFLNVTAKLSIDDLGYTITDKPANNSVYTQFEEFGVGSGLSGPITIGASPNSATFDGGQIVASVSCACGLIHSQSQGYAIRNGEEFTVIFETPAYEVDFYAQSVVRVQLQDPDGSFEVYDTNDNLLGTFTNFESGLDPQFKPKFFTVNAVELGAPGGIGRLVFKDDPDLNDDVFSHTGIDDFGFTPIGAPGTGSEGPPPADAPSITTQPANQEVASGAAASLSVAANGDDLSYQWYTGNSGDTASPVAGATTDTLNTGALTASTSFWVQITNVGGTADSETAVVTVAAPAVPLVLDGTGDIAG